MATPNLALPFVAEGQAQPHVTHNEALDFLDAAFPAIAASATLVAAPDDPAEGACYILPPGAWGFGSVLPGEIALRHGGAWHAITPAFGWRWFVVDEGAARVFNGAAWRPGDITGPRGSTLGIGLIEVEAELSGPTVTLAEVIPTRCTVLAVTSWTIEEVTGAPSYSVGLPGDPAKFGGYLGAGVGANNVGGVGPYFTYSPEDLVVTADSGAFTGGRVGLSVAILRPGAPV